MRASWRHEDRRACRFRSLRRRRDDDGELRAAVGTVLCPDAPVFGRQQSSRDPETHTRARRARLRCVASIEPIEEVRQVGRRDSGAVVAHLESPNLRPVTRALTSIVEPGGAVLARHSRAGAPAPWRSAADRAAPARPDRRSRPLCARAASVPPGRAPPRRSPRDAPSAIRRRWRPRRCAPSRGCSETTASVARLPPGSGRSAPAARRASATTPGCCSPRRGWRSAACADRVPARPAAPSSAPRSGASARPPCALRETARARSRWRRRRRACRACPPRWAGPRRRAGRSASCRPAAARAESSDRRRPSSRWPA